MKNHRGTFWKVKLDLWLSVLEAASLLMMQTPARLHAVRGLLRARLPEAGQARHLLQGLRAAADTRRQVEEEKSVSSGSGRTSI